MLQYPPDQEFCQLQIPRNSLQFYCVVLDRHYYPVIQRYLLFAYRIYTISFTCISYIVLAPRSSLKADLVECMERKRMTHSLRTW